MGEPYPFNNKHVLVTSGGLCWSLVCNLAGKGAGPAITSRSIKTLNEQRIWTTSGFAIAALGTDLLFNPLP